MESTQSQQTNSYTDEEKALAEKYKVEPKTVRLISEIVSEHTEVKQGNPAESEQPSTEKLQLDELSESASCEAVALAHGCLELYLADMSLGEKIREKLDFIFQEALSKFGP